ncbi:hypothetical protein L195_g033429 [Trifolium pratense]|uniref:Uncharacterized protein n=1 Tax=Trifolium pratense TaxID=57577 RepID=A0A2K3LG02_TRIPR|nr:hypothetical protein L195_g033429 [Trifolium pratense]
MHKPGGRRWNNFTTVILRSWVLRSWCVCVWWSIEKREGKPPSCDGRKGGVGGGDCGW